MGSLTLLLVVVRMMPGFNAIIAMVSCENGSKKKELFSFQCRHLAEAQRRRAQVRNGERGSAAARPCFLYYDLRQSPLLLPIVGGGRRENERERYVMRLPTLFIPFCGRNSAHWRVAFKASSGMVGRVS